MKKTYNLSQIFKAAWSLVKSNGLTISEGLKSAWKAVKSGSNINDVKNTLLAYCGHYKTTEKVEVLAIISQIGEVAKEKGNQFISDVCGSVVKFSKLSEKQAYCIARFYAESGLSFRSHYFSL